MRIELMNGETVINTIIADAAFSEEHHPGAWRIAAQQDMPAPLAPRYISVGAFFDRFGPLKWSILADEAPAVRAVVQDASVRKYIDLDRADLPMGLQVLIDAGHAIDSEAILTAPVQPHEVP